MQVKNPPVGSTVLIVERAKSTNPVWPILKTHGFLVLGPASTAKEALSLIEDVKLNVAILEYRVLADDSGTLLERLDSMDVPVCLLAEEGREHLPEEFAKYPTLQEPYLAAPLLVLVGHTMYS